MRHFLLLGTLGCHLCDLAEQCLVNALVGVECQVEVVDIAEEEQFMRFAEQIPVLLDEHSSEALYWPFNEQQVRDFVIN